MAQHKGRQEDSGITLVELLIYMLFAVVVLTIVGSILINSLRVEAQVRDGSESTSTAQLVAESIGQGVRNASAVEVLNPAAGELLLRTRSIDGSVSGSWYCQAWSWVDGEVRTARSPSAIALPDDSTLATWTLLAENVEAVGTSPVFALGADERSLDLTFTVDIGEGVPVLIDSVVVAQQPIPATGKVTAPCF